MPGKKKKDNGKKEQTVIFSANKHTLLWTSLTLRDSNIYSLIKGKKKLVVNLCLQVAQIS